MKILIVGLGSIGQRHLQNIKKIRNDLEIFALIKDIDIHRFIKDGKSSFVEDIGKHYGIKTIKSLDEAKDIKPDIVFVANPSSMHVETALEFAKIGCDLFIEKPLGSSLEGVEELEKTIKDKNIISQVGFQTRFNPLIKEVKSIIEGKKDKIMAGSFEWSNIFLPFHHKYEDYTKGYAARKDLGGGAVLGLIHEIDLMYYLLGMPKRVYAAGGKLSDLDMDAEDTALSIFEYDRIPVSMSLSYAQAKEVRRFKIQFSDGTLFVDLLENKYELYDKQGEMIKQNKINIERNDLFLSEVSYFFDCVAQRKESDINVAKARKSLEIALKMKESIEKKEPIHI